MSSPCLTPSLQFCIFKKICQVKCQSPILMGWKFKYLHLHLIPQAQITLWGGFTIWNHEKDPGVWMWNSLSKKFKKYICIYILNNIYKFQEDSISPAHFIFSWFYFGFPKTANPISFSGRGGSNISCKVSVSLQRQTWVLTVGGGVSLNIVGEQ